MGYSTNYVGKLQPLDGNQRLTLEQEMELESFFEEDVRDHPEWQKFLFNSYATYIDLGWGEGNTVKYNGAEKSNDMVDNVNLITAAMREKWPEFRFQGEFFCQGDEVGDVWYLRFDANGHAYRDEAINRTTICVCPNCGTAFNPNDREY